MSPKDDVPQVHDHEHADSLKVELPEWFSALSRHQQDSLRGHSNTIFKEASWERKSHKYLAKTRRSPPYAIFRNIITSIFRYFFTLFTSFSTILSDPLGFGWNIFAWPMLHTGLVVLESIAFIIYSLGLYKGLSRFAEEFASDPPEEPGEKPKAYSVVNWFDRRMFSSKVHEISRLALVDGQGLPPASLEELKTVGEHSPNVRYFNIDIAKSLLLMSTLMYERNDVSYMAAEKIVMQNKLSPQQKKDQIMTLIWKSQSHIRKQAREWGMHFSGITDFTTIGGPFCGIFTPDNVEEENWIVLAFKGTSPTDIGEFLVDATLEFHDGAAFFGSGYVHQGFYTSLCPGAGSPADPYGDIVTAIRNTAAQMREKMKQKKGKAERVNLWVTGHSLGAALASLTYARLLACQEDLGPDVALCQAFVYGCPRCADGAFISHFDFLMNRPFLNTNQALWRIDNDTDIVTRIPPGLADDERNRGALPAHSLLNYGHFGTAAIRLMDPWKGELRYKLGLDEREVTVDGVDTDPKTAPGFTIKKGSVRGGSEIKMVEHKKGTMQDAEILMQRGLMSTRPWVFLGHDIDIIKVMYNMVCLVPNFSNHLPSEYWRRLASVRPDFVVGLEEKENPSDSKEEKKERGMLGVLDGFVNGTHRDK